MRIGDTRTTVCKECKNEISWILRQRIVGAEGMRDAIAIWDAQEHQRTEIEVTDDLDVELCPPQSEAVREPVEGVITEEQRSRIVAGKDYSPEVDPVFEPYWRVDWKDPRISCIMPTTAKRTWCLSRSIRCWLRQTWENRDLVIVSDGPGFEDISAAIAEPLREENYLPVPMENGQIYEGNHLVRHFHLPDDPTRVLGEKYNACVEIANGPFIAPWADDDWHHQQRLEVVMRSMQRQRTPVGSTNTMLCYRQRDQRTFLYWVPGLRPSLISGTMLFTKRHWEEAGGFPKKQRASDSGFVARLLQERKLPWTAVDDPRLYCAFLHGENTGNPLGDTFERSAEQMASFSPLEGEEANMRRHLGGDAEAFGF